MNIKYCGDLRGASGYAQFGRGFVLALDRAGINVWADPAFCDGTRPDLGECQAALDRLSQERFAPDVKIINAPAEMFEELREDGMPNIGFTMCETSRIPDRWVTRCNRMDGILVPCEWNRQVFERSGVQVPIRVAAPGLDVEEFAAPPAVSTIQGHLVRSRAKSDLLPALANARRRLMIPSSFGRLLGPSVKLALRLAARRRTQTVRCSLDRFGASYKFYSVFQWTERKNPRGLLEAFFAEFHQEDDVCLILKTYGSGFGARHTAKILKEVERVQDSMRLPKFPDVIVVSDLLSNDQIRHIHWMGDCFVLPHRGEGLGMPQMEALACGKPVITTGYSGNMEFTHHDNSYLLPYQLRPVTGMEWVPWYESDMSWAEPDLDALRLAMRNVYEHRDEAVERGKRGRNFIFSEFNWPRRTSVLLDALSEILDVHTFQVRDEATLFK